jgi:hypothetical protein
MDTRRYAIIDGPDKPALQSSLANTGEQDVYFRVEGDAFNAQFLRMDEEVDGFTFRVHGRLTWNPIRWFELRSKGGANNG